MYNIYVYKLQNGRDTFLLSAYQECEFLYQEIVKTNPILELNHIEYDVLPWQIDALVHKYMHEYGLENIRGGRYNRLHLSDAEKQEISDAIKFFAYEVEEQQARVEKYAQYVSTDIDANECMKHIREYEELETRRKLFQIDRSIIDELEWLINIITKNPLDKFFLHSSRYYKLMYNLSIVYQQFHRVVEEAEDLSNQIHKLYNHCAICPLIYDRPYTFFDGRVIPSERKHTKYTWETDKSLECVIKMFELSIYYLINREDEVIFDLGLIDLQENKDKLFIAQSTKTCILDPMMPLY
jgi:hypothetical protein